MKVISSLLDTFSLWASRPCVMSLRNERYPTSLFRHGCTTLHHRMRRTRIPFVVGSGTPSEVDVFAVMLWAALSFSANLRKKRLSAFAWMMRMLALGGQTVTEHHVARLTYRAQGDSAAAETQFPCCPLSTPRRACKAVDTS